MQNSLPTPYKKGSTAIHLGSFLVCERAFLSHSVEKLWIYFPKGCGKTVSYFYFIVEKLWRDFYLYLKKKVLFIFIKNLEKKLKKSRLKWKNWGLFLFYCGKIVEKFFLIIEKKSSIYINEYLNKIAWENRAGGNLIRIVGGLFYTRNLRVYLFQWVTKTFLNFFWRFFSEKFFIKGELVFGATKSDVLFSKERVKPFAVCRPWF